MPKFWSWRGAQSQAEDEEEEDEDEDFSFDKAPSEVVTLEFCTSFILEGFSEPATSKAFSRNPH